MVVRNVPLVRQAGGVVVCREFGDVVGGLDGLLDRRFGKITGGRVAAFFTDVNRDAQRLVPVALDVFQLALAHADRQAAAFGGFGSGIAGTELFGMRQGGVHQTFKNFTRIAEAFFGLVGSVVASGSRW